jgi:hypothetical protein
MRKNGPCAVAKYCIIPRRACEGICGINKKLCFDLLIIIFFYQTQGGKVVYSIDKFFLIDS